MPNDVDISGKFRREFSEYEKELIHQLRKEAEDVKDCFTKFSFQALSITSVALGLLVRYQPDYPWMGVISFFVVVLSISVMRIGTYKYATANRHYGFELFLDRVYRLSGSENCGWKPSYFHFGWEEGLRAWRVVQASVFESLYRSESWSKISLRVPALQHGAKAKDAMRLYKYPWFDASLLLPNDRSGRVKYHAGNYLRTMISMLTITAACGMLSLFVMVVQHFYLAELGFKNAVSNFELLRANNINVVEFVGSLKPLGGFSLSALIFLLVTVFGTLKIMQIQSRRKLLESGILSIHSCAIMWQIVITAHHRALEELDSYVPGDSNNAAHVRSLRGYTAELSKVTEGLLSHVGHDRDIYDWLDGPEILVTRSSNIEAETDLQS